MRKLIRVDLLIIDDFALSAMDPAGGDGDLWQRVLQSTGQPGDLVGRSTSEDD